MDGTEQVSAMSEQMEVDLEIPTGVDEPLADAGDDAVQKGEGCEKPPTYDSLGLDHPDHPDLPEQKNTFIADAPPSYQQLFGRKASSQTPQRRPHTRSRRRQSQHQSDQSIVSQLQERCPKLSKLLARLTVVCVIVCLIGLSAAMILVGSFNFYRCSSMEVPIYLVVAGLLMVAELLFHGILWFLMKYSDNDSTYRALRMCDCVAFVLLVWLLIGSNWVFKVSIARASTCDTLPVLIDDVIQHNTTVITDSSGGTQLRIMTETPYSTPIPSCKDCSSGVYQFTVVVILFQYIAALLVIVACCSKLFKK